MLLSHILLFHGVHGIQNISDTEQQTEEDARLSCPAGIFVRVPETRSGTAQRACLLYTSFVFRYPIIFQPVQFVPSQEYHLFSGGFQFGLESVVCNILMMPFLEAPAQKPFETTAEVVS